MRTDLWAFMLGERDYIEVRYYGNRSEPRGSHLIATVYRDDPHFERLEDFYDNRGRVAVRFVLGPVDLAKE